MKEGSCLVTLLVFVCLISFFCLHIWRITVSLFESTLVKQQYIQHYQLSQGLLTWGIDLCNNNFDKIVEYNTIHKSGLIVEIPNVGADGIRVDGKLLWKNHLKNNLYSLQLTTKLVRDKKTLMQLSCIIYKEYDTKNKIDRYRISKWRLQNKTELVA